MVPEDTQNLDYLPLATSSSGIQVGDTILWLESKLEDSLCFISSVRNVPTHFKKAIVTEEAVRLFQHRKPNSGLLSCQYNRPFNIGSLRVELLPSGQILGGSSLFLETNGKSLMYVPEFLMEKTGIHRKMQIKSADTLVIGAFSQINLEHIPSRRKELERLIQRTKDAFALKKPPLIFCNPLGIGQELTKILEENDLPVTVHGQIHKLNKVYESCGVNLGDFSLLNRRTNKNKAILIPIDTRSTSIATEYSHERPILVVDSLKSLDFGEYFSIENRSQTPQQFKELVQKVKPKKVYIYGPYAKSYSEALTPSVKNLEAVYPNSQPTLF